MSARVTNRHVLDELREQREEQRFQFVTSILLGIATAGTMTALFAVLDAITEPHINAFKTLLFGAIFIGSGATMAYLVETRLETKSI
jgi:hypothetical protein